jgi:predicted RNA-binding Zn ribbon-like protein
MRDGHTRHPAKLVHEELCIRFVNTVAWRLADHQEDRIGTPERLLAWLAAAELVETADVARIRTRWKQSPRDAASFLNGAVKLREAIYSLLVARIEGQRVDAPSLDILNAHLTCKPHAAQLVATRKGLKCRGSKAAPGLFAPIAWSAATLLLGPRARKIRQCQDERGCGWLFHDESRAQNRRWCSMGDCGNLAKARRHYRRATRASAARKRTPRKSRSSRRRLPAPMR